MESADLGGRVGWLPKAERVKTLFLSPLQPQNAGRVGGGGRGGYPGFVSLQVPNCEAARLRKKRFLWGKGPNPLVGRAPSPGGPGPQAPGAWIPPLSPLNFRNRVFNFLQRKPMGPGLKTLGCYHNPQSAYLGGRWMVSQGRALQYHERRGSRLRSSISANKPLSPASRQPSRVKNSKNAPVLIGS